MERAPALHWADWYGGSTRASLPALAVLSGPWTSLTLPC